MPYISLDNLTRYDGKIKNYARTLFSPSNAMNWQKTETAGSVSFYPVPETLLEPAVNFSFTETPPASGDKSPANTSTITGVSSVTVTHCESADVAETDYIISLDGTYYGGTIDVATGKMSVTFFGMALDGTEEWIDSSSSEVKRYHINLPRQSNNNRADQTCSHLPYSSAGYPSFDAFRVTENFLYVTYDADSLEAFESWLEEQKEAGTPVVVVYKLKTPYTVDLAATRIFSLPQVNEFTPRLNTVYSDQQSVQVGYAKSPIYTEQELTNAIVALGGNL